MRKTGKIKHCNYCGKDIYVPGWRIKKSGNYCSNICWGKFKKTLPFYEQPQYRGKSKIIECVQCGEMFKTNGAKGNIYCSNSCKQTMLVKHGKDNYMWKGGEVEKNCKQCNKKYFSKPSQKSKFCSKDCCNIDKMKIRREAHWRWKGITPENKLQRIKFRNMMQKQVFERDDYTCQICGERGGKLQVDHIQSWAEYIELRFEMKNLRTLCMACHYKITFGRDMPEDVTAWGHNLSQIERVV